MISKIKKIIEQDDKALSLMIFFLFIGVFILILVDLQTGITVLGTGLATLAGAFTAFSCEKRDKANKKYRNELKELKYAKLALIKMDADISISLQAIAECLKSESYDELKCIVYSLTLNLKDISFIVDTDEDVLLHVSLYCDRYKSFLNLVKNYNDFIVSSNELRGNNPTMYRLHCRCKLEAINRDYSDLKNIKSETFNEFTDFYCKYYPDVEV